MWRPRETSVFARVTNTNVFGQVAKTSEDHFVQGASDAKERGAKVKVCCLL